MPDGSAESFTDDVDWVACNLEHPAQQWELTRVFERANNVGAIVIPWVRLAHIEAGDGIRQVREKLEKLVDAANRWNSSIILPNYENEADFISPLSVETELEATGWRDDPFHAVGWSTLAWLSNDADYTPMANKGDCVLLQIFPTDARWEKTYDVINTKMGDCVYHARVDKGFVNVGVTYQTYADATPDWYNVVDYQHSTYPGNVIEHGEWPSWYL